MTLDRSTAVREYLSPDDLPCPKSTVLSRRPGSGIGHRPLPLGAVVAQLEATVTP